MLSRVEPTQERCGAASWPSAAMSAHGGERLVARRAAGAVGDAEELGLRRRRARRTTVFSFSLPTGVFGGKNSKLTGTGNCSVVVVMGSPLVGRHARHGERTRARLRRRAWRCRTSRARRGRASRRPCAGASRHGRRRLAVLDLAAAADVDRLQLELRLDEQEQLAVAEQRHERRQHQRQRDEGQVADDRSKRATGSWRGFEVARVDAFERGHARVGGAAADAAGRGRRRRRRRASRRAAAARR